MIGEWILILTMVGNSSIFIEKVGPFLSEQHCQVAGKAWMKSTYPKNDNRIVFSFAHSNYVCVKT